MTNPALIFINVVNKLKNLRIKLENNYRSFIWFVFKLILWVFVLFWLTSLLGATFINSFKPNNVTVNDFILFLTATFIIAYTYEAQKQAKTSEQIVALQIMPAIEIFLIYDYVNNGSSIAFYNLSLIPGVITFDLFIRQNENTKEIKYRSGIRYRIPPQGVLITESAFLEVGDLPKNIELKKDLEVRITALIIPDLDDINPDVKRTYGKSYRFMDGHHNTLNNKRWDEKSIGFPDVLCFAPENTNLKGSIALLIKEYLEKSKT
ncbi:hypothetical protein D4R51_01345 [bacterium]|nr:MAG: hypothetical protein D4R51_01345 [bacterium]